MGAFNIATSFAVSIVRLGAGTKSNGARVNERLKPLIVYEFEACPFCRKVRETLTELDLNAEIRPCPKGGTRFRQEAMARGGKQQFPYLIDPNTGWEGYESASIVEYLFNQYGADIAAGPLINGPLADINSFFASVMRPNKGLRKQFAKPAKELLEIYSIEGSPYCRIVREKLCELEISYLLHNVGAGSPSREAFVKLSGKMMVPYLIDPNTDTAMFESAEIVRYLEETYSIKQRDGVIETEIKE